MHKQQIVLTQSVAMHAPYIRGQHVQTIVVDTTINLVVPQTSVSSYLLDGYGAYLLGTCIPAPFAASGHSVPRNCVLARGMRQKKNEAAAQKDRGSRLASSHILPHVPNLQQPTFVSRHVVSERVAKHNVPDSFEIKVLRCSMSHTNER